MFALATTTHGADLVRIPIPHLLRDDFSLVKRFYLRTTSTEAILILQGDTNVRTAHRADFGGGLRRLHWILFSFGLSAPAFALPPLVIAADVAQPELSAFAKEGELWVGMPNQPERPGMRPLVDTQARTLPPSLEGFEIIGEECQPVPGDSAEFGGRPVKATVAGDAMQPVIRLERDERPIAHSLLGRPATVCSLHLLNIDRVPGLEVLVAWRFEELRGFTVYRIPESLDPTTPNRG